MFNRTVSGLGLVLLLASAAGAQAAQPLQDPASLTPGCRAAQAYMTTAPNVAEVFAEKVDYIGPDGKAKSSKADIKAGYAAAAKTMTEKAKPATFRIAHLVPIGERECLMEFEQTDPATGEYFLVAIDHFKVDEAGKVVFFRPFVQTAAIMKNPVFRAGLMGGK